jgi:hypothetical protein
MQAHFLQSFTLRSISIRELFTRRKPIRICSIISDNCFQNAIKLREITESVFVDGPANTLRKLCEDSAVLVRWQIWPGSKVRSVS